MKFEKAFDDIKEKVTEPISYSETPDDVRIVYSYRSVPTIKRFSESRTRWRSILGPFGSGKSSGCVMDILQKAKEQAPGPDGVRRSRWAVVRNTYPQLKDTTIKTFCDWIPPRYFGTYKEAAHDFIIDQLTAEDGSPVHLEVMFRALDRPDHVRNLLSLELTGCWFNEVREIGRMIFDAMDGRIGRFPPQRDGGASWRGIICDTNPPDVKHWFYKLFEEDRPKEKDGSPRTEVFHQPSGLSPEAENIPNLEKGYYDNLAIGKSLDFVRVYVHGEYGFVSDGKPVYHNWMPTIHIAPLIIKPTPGYPLICGWDFGVDAGVSAIFGQMLTNGPKLNILYEFVAEDMGVRRFIEYIVKPHIMNEYGGFNIYHTGDPSGVKRSDIDERTCFQEIKKHFFTDPIPARSNTLTARYDAVDTWLTKWAGAGNDGKPLPAFQVSPNCEMLIQGFNGGYRMRRLLVSGYDKYEEKPEKTIESHPHDALQYLALLTETPMHHRRIFGRWGTTPVTPPPAAAWQ